MFAIHFPTVQCIVGETMSQSKCPTCVALHALHMSASCSVSGSKKEALEFFLYWYSVSVPMLLSSSQLLLKFPYDLPSLVLIIANCSHHVF